MNDTPARATVALSVTAMGTGLVAAIIGLLTVAGYAAHIAGLKAPAAATVAELSARSSHVLVETLLCLVFAMVAGLCLALRRQRLTVRITAAMAATLKIALLAGLLAAYWKPGWYYILDPNGAHPWAQVLIVISALQALALIALAAVNHRGNTPPPS